MKTFEISRFQEYVNKCFKTTLNIAIQIVFQFGIRSSKQINFGSSKFERSDHYLLKMRFCNCKRGMQKQWFGFVVRALLAGLPFPRYHCSRWQVGGANGRVPPPRLPSLHVGTAQCPVHVRRPPSQRVVPLHLHRSGPSRW